MKLPRWRLFPKYATLIIAVVAGVLVISGAINLVFSWRETQAHLVALQMEKAQGAATRIEQYVLDIEHELGWTAFPLMDLAGDPIEQRRIEYLKLQRQVQSITELVWIGNDGRERLLVSRLAMETVDSAADRSKDPAFVAARAGKTWFGPVQFRKGTEPYMAIARPAGADGGVTVADVNLKFVWDVVSRIKIGQSGLAYVVDATGTLIAHPDISLVLKKTDLRSLPQVAALERGDSGGLVAARDLAGQEVFTAHVRIPALNWTVFVESPRAEALAPLRESIVRLVLVLLGGLLLAAAESFFLARALVRPIRALQEGAARIGAGELDQRIQVKSGDELERLAEQFNKMGSELQASYAGLERKVEERTHELSEALEQQTATADILRVISESPTDVQPVMEAVAERSRRLCRADGSRVWLLHGDHLRSMTSYKFVDGAESGRDEVLPLKGTSVVGRAFVDRRTVHVADVATLVDSDYPDTRVLYERYGFRTVLGVPMLREGVSIGTIGVLRKQVQPFSVAEIRLVEIFAAQAVIAIENVRLFNETKESLERQTATAEILRVISGSPTNVQPVLDTVAERSGALCRAEGSRVWLLQGGKLCAMTSYGSIYSDDAREALPLGRGSVVARAFADRALVHVHDVVPLIDTEYPDVRQLQARYGFRTVLAVPMLREGESVGVITLLRNDVRPFAAAEIALVQAFADQAVIAIENVRLFNETKEALEQQTATAEVLQVISGSVANAQPVFEKILDSCERLFGASDLGIFLTGDDGTLRAGAFRGILMKTTASTYPRPLQGTVSGMAIANGSVLHVPDMLVANEMPQYIRDFAGQVGNFSVALAPMMWEGAGIGTIDIIRTPPRPYSEKELALLKTFADQAVIAIQNARLFNETKEALEQQTATAEVLRVISSSVADTAPVFEKILHSCSHLFESSEQGVVLLGEDGLLHLGAHRGSARDRLAAMFPMTGGDEPVAHAMAEQRVLHYVDVLRDAEPASLSRVVAERLGVGSYTQVFAPMRWEGRGVGYLYVIRSPVAGFSDKEIGLLKTFADQAAIAIQNARLFNEIENKSRQLEAANRHKSEFLANMSHELRTPLNAIIGFSEVLAERMFGDVNDKQMEYLQDIHSSGQHLLALINDVLDLSKIEAGKMELDLSCFDLGLLLEHSATLVRERAQRHGLSLELEVDDGLAEWVADARKVKQVVVNLLTNAVKFTPNGGSVSVRARHLNGMNGHAGDWAEVSVSDTGIGIKREDQALVFEEFRQASGDVLRKAEGTGLGLALVKRFVELHGGEITLNSEPGRGSTFRFTLPQHEVKVLQ